MLFMSRRTRRVNTATTTNFGNMSEQKVVNFFSDVFFPTLINFFWNPFAIDHYTIDFSTGIPKTTKNIICSILTFVLCSTLLVEISVSKM